MWHGHIMRGEETHVTRRVLNMNAGWIEVDLGKVDELYERCYGVRKE